MLRSEDNGRNENFVVNPAGILPYMVIRRAGLRSVGFGKLILRDTSENLSQQVRLEGTCLTLSKQLVVSLEEVIGPRLPRTVNAELIELKRDLFNDRLPKHGLTVESRVAIDNRNCRTFQADLSLWYKLWRRRVELYAEGSDCFTRECKAQRNTFRNLVRNVDFGRGLALSSPHLSSELARYIAVDEDGVLRRVRRTEISLARYYSRCTHKISPYSTFMKAGLWRIASEDMENAGAETKTRSTRIRRSATLNRTMIRSLATALAVHPEFSEQLPVFWNSTIANCGDSMLVVSRHYSTTLPARLRVPRETIYCFRGSRTINEIHAYLQRSGGMVSKRELVTWLAGRSNSPDAAKDYVDMLILRSVLIEAIPFKDSHGSNIAALLEYVDRFPTQDAAPFRCALREIEQAESQLPNASTASRIGLIEQLDGSVKAAFAILRTGDNPSWNSMHIYEDCIEEPIRRINLQANWKDALSDLHRFVSLYGALLDGNISSRETLKRIHQSEFRGKPQPFLEIVKAYRKNIMASDLGGAAEAHTPNPCNLETLVLLRQLREEMGRMASESSRVEEIDLEAVSTHHEWTQRFLQLEITATAENVLFFSCYGQPIVKSSGAEGILLSALNHPLGAICRYAGSMSIPHERDAVVEGIRVSLEKIWPEAAPCEVASIFDFNANLHPRITDHRIAYDNAGPLEDQDIPLGEIFLSSESERHLMLYSDRLDKRLVPIELGMMASSVRPLIHHLLLSIGNADPVLHKNFFHPYHWNFCDGPSERVENFPRIVFGRCVLRRRGWAIPLSALPRRGPKDSDYQYFILVKKWWRQMGLPDEVFVAADFSGHSQLKPGDNRHTINLRKPQYIHFANVLLLNVLEKLIAEIKSFLYVEEALPNRTDLAALGLSRPFEFVADVYAPYRPMREVSVTNAVTEMSAEGMK